MRTRYIRANPEIMIFISPRILNAKFWAVSREFPPHRDTPIDTSSSSPPHGIVRGSAKTETEKKESTRIVTERRMRRVF